MTWKYRAFTLAALILSPAGLLGADGWGAAALPAAREGMEALGLPPRATCDAYDDLALLVPRWSPYRQDLMVSSGWPEGTADEALTQTEDYPRLAFLPHWDVDRLFSDHQPAAKILLTSSGQAQAEQGVLFADATTALLDEPLQPTPVQSPYRPLLALRFGWWSVETDGELTKVGEYQDLGSGPFFDVDTLLSDGNTTLDLSATELDNEDSQVRLDFFTPQLSVRAGYQRYPHRLDHDPLANMGDMTSGEEIIREDLNVGGDYAIRVEDLKTSFKGRLTKNIKMRLNFRLLRKHGERQAKAMQHCYCEIQEYNCHVLSQRQRIDWVTAKFEPVIEGKFGPVRAQYSRPMRLFEQNDQIVMRPFGLHDVTDQPYGFVPENITQVDRLKLGVDLAAKTSFYARLHTGDTRNKLRETHRRFYGFDLRLTNRSVDGMTVTGYATLNEQKNQNLPFLLSEEEEALAVETSIVPPYGIRRPIDFFRRAVGADASWRPFRLHAAFRGLSLTTGAEQGLIERNYADYTIQVPEEPPGPVVKQERTAYTSFHAGASFRWSPSLETHVRYRLRVTKDPLFALNEYYGFTGTSIPEEQNVVELGGTWMLATNFLATATVGLENRRHRSDVADFEEDDYPMTFTLWYAPTPKWSLSAGYGFYSNWINQDIVFPSDTPDESIGETRRWNYGGRGRVLSLGGRYAWTRRLTLSGGVQYVWARDAFDPLVPWPDLPQYSDVIVNRARVTAGIDWLLREDVSAYVRYLYEDYEDESVDFNSGTAQMLLTGFSAVY